MGNSKHLILAALLGILTLPNVSKVIRSSSIFKETTDSFIDQDDLNESPVIGIVTVPLSPPMKQDPRSQGYSSYLMQTYVNFVESAGARVVPIIHNEPKEVTLEKLARLDGVLLPGGWGQSYYELGELIYHTLIKYNDNGTFYPLWGTCVGFDYMASYAAGCSKEALQANLSAIDVSLPLKFTKDPRTSKMYQSFAENAYLFEDHNLTFNHHQTGIHPETFETNQGLKDMFEINALSYTEDGTPFVASMESLKYPFFATLFHPEKATQSWIDNKGLNHSWLSMYLNRHFVDYFVQLARRNPNKPGTFSEVQKLIVQNYKMIVTDTYYGAVYVFE